MVTLSSVCLLVFRSIYKPQNMRRSQEAMGVSDTVRGTVTGRGYRLFYYYVI